jgi:sporulation protein YqfC
MAGGGGLLPNGPAGPAQGDGTPVPPAPTNPVLGWMEGLGLPLDLARDLPRITVLGGLVVTIENHRGLVEFQPTRVAVSTAHGRVVLTGDDLSVRVAHPDEIVVTGRLAAIALRPQA